MKKKLITSALPYVNNVPHLGNIIGSVLSADVYARFCRSMGHETLYICATDEYGTATENKARQEGTSPREICDKYHGIHKAVYDYFDIQFDYFGRTSTPEHTVATQEYFTSLRDNGYITERTDNRAFCPPCDMFLADRYIEGTCPHCSYDGARGDQCDTCGKLLQPEELIDPKCVHCSGAPITKETSHLYLDLVKLQPLLETYVKSAKTAGHWPRNAVSTTESWFRKGLDVRPITRDLKWGVPVPQKGYEKKVFYVWFDAPIGYVSQTRRLLPDTWESWWKNPGNVELCQFMAKDNIPFHTVVFPACQLGTGQNWTMLHHIGSTEYLNYENAKFSKSRGVGVFGDTIRETGIDIELWRLYLILNRPEKSDSRFSWHGFFEEINSAFIDNIGNLLNRTVMFAKKHFNGTLPPVSLEPNLRTFNDAVMADAEAIIALYENASLRDAAHRVLFMGNKGNKLFQETRPWVCVKTDRDGCAQILAVITQLLSTVACLLSPIMPKTAKSIFDILGTTPINPPDLKKQPVLNGHTYGEPHLLFPKLDPALAEVFRKKYGGTPNEPPQASPKEALFSRAALKVGKIVSIKRHPNAERLYIERVDCGEGSPRQIISGVAEHFDESELLDRNVVVVAGLKPASIRKERSEGMLLTFEYNGKLEFPDVSSFSPGTRLTVVGENTDATQEEKPITIDEFHSLGLRLDNGTVKMAEHTVVVGEVPLTAPTFKDGTVS